VTSGGAPAKESFKTKFFLFPLRGALLCALSVALILSAASCKRQPAGKLTQTQIHQITQELAKAASEAAPAGTLVKVRRARNGAVGGVDELYIGLHANSVARNRVLQQLQQVAARHRLVADVTAAGANSSRITLRSVGTVTHRLEIEILGPGTPANTDRSPHPAGRLAILLDDLGSDRSAADAIFGMQVPITVSVLPYHPHTRDIAQDARKHGCEVMLHLPMQSVGKESPEQQELRPGLSRDQVEDIVTRMLDAVPEADGVNNHQGSQATSNSALMDELMPVLRDAGVFYVDSRTTPETVAYDTAKRIGVKTAFRNVPFLDDVQDKAAVKRQLQAAIRGAREKGEAIAIGHPHTATLQALREILPEIKKQGVQLVLVSEVVH
jgi:polysaccharide deacetylase 2 family uncharacterized protein YibQ